MSNEKKKSFGVAVAETLFMCSLGLSGKVNMKLFLYGEWEVDNMVR
jgi:hypothetical protein